MSAVAPWIIYAAGVANGILLGFVICSIVRNELAMRREQRVKARWW